MENKWKDLEEELSKTLPYSKVSKDKKWITVKGIGYDEEGKPELITIVMQYKPEFDKRYYEEK
jgi:hypothetical protein